MGPLLFLLYINDILSDIGSNIRPFADDTNIFIVVDDPLTAAGQLKTLLFLLYISDILTDIGSNIRPFTDDTCIFIVVDDTLTAAGQLKTDLEKMSL